MPEQLAHLAGGQAVSCCCHTLTPEPAGGCREAGKPAAAPKGKRQLQGRKLKQAMDALAAAQVRRTVPGLDGASRAASGIGLPLAAHCMHTTPTTSPRLPCPAGCKEGQGGAAPGGRGPQG